MCIVLSTCSIEVTMASGRSEESSMLACFPLQDRNRSHATHAVQSRSPPGLSIEDLSCRANRPINLIWDGNAFVSSPPIAYYTQSARGVSQSLHPACAERGQTLYHGSVYASPSPSEGLPGASYRIALVQVLRSPLVTNQRLCPSLIDMTS